MVERQRRLLEVYAHLHDHCGVHTQKDLAHILRYSRVYISSALNGNEKNLTDKLFKSRYALRGLVSLILITFSRAKENCSIMASRNKSMKCHPASKRQTSWRYTPTASDCWMTCAQVSAKNSPR